MKKANFHSLNTDGKYISDKFETETALMDAWGHRFVM
jgi:hypothetical protein